MRLIETKTIVSPTAWVELLNLPQDISDILIHVSARTSQSGQRGTFAIYPNSFNNHSFGRILYSPESGSPAVAQSFVNYSGEATGASSNLNSFGNSRVYIPEATSNKLKSFSSDSVGANAFGFAGDSFPGFASGYWANFSSNIKINSPITSLIVAAGAGASFVEGTNISLYGIRKGSDGITISS
jgi:hypothetical protein